jgi:hypothetical protein
MPSLQAQDTRTRLLGRVQDSSGSVVARKRPQYEHWQWRIRGVSDQRLGDFLVPFPVPGNDRLSRRSITARR